LGVDFADLAAVDKIAKKRKSDIFWSTMERDIAIGVGTGAGMGAAPGAGVGAIVGVVGGAVEGGVRAAYADAETRDDKTLQKAMAEIGKQFTRGLDVTDISEVTRILTEEYGVLADEAEILAKSFADNSSELLEYSKVVAEYEKKNNAYYTAMRANIQQSLDLSQYTAN
jgi:hypothetical protein